MTQMDRLKAMRILIVEDDRDAASWLVKGLTEAGHIADHAADGEDGLNMAREKVHDVIIVDRMLPKLDGLALIRRLRERGRSDAGSHPECARRCRREGEGLARRWRRLSGQALFASPSFWLASRALPRRSAAEPQQTRLSVLDLEMNLLARTVTRAGKPILLQPREFKLLEYLMRNAGHVVTRTMLLENVWDYHFDPQTNVIDVHISQASHQDRQGLSRAHVANRPRRRIYDPCPLA